MKNIIAVILIFVIAFSLFGCAPQEAANSTPVQEQTPEQEMANSHFINILEEDSYSSGMRLVYDSVTHIVYYYQNYRYDKTAAASLCPYYSANGYLCRYNTDTNKIEEIIR